MLGSGAWLMGVNLVVGIALGVGIGHEEEGNVNALMRNGYGVVSYPVPLNSLGSFLLSSSHSYNGCNVVWMEVGDGWFVVVADSVAMLLWSWFCGANCVESYCELRY